jgi:hypothetical protein
MTLVMPCIGQWGSSYADNALRSLCSFAAILF